MGSVYIRLLYHCRQQYVLAHRESTTFDVFMRKDHQNRAQCNVTLNPIDICF